MDFSINFLSNILVIALGALALIAGILIFPATRKYKIATITSTHSKTEWSRISALERAIAVFYLIIFSVVVTAVSYDIVTFGPEIAIWLSSDIWHYTLLVMFVPFAAIIVCSAVLLPLILKAKKAKLCSAKNIALLKNSSSGIAKKSASAVCCYSIFVCAFNMLAGAAVIALTFLRFITSTAIFADNEFIQLIMAGVIILSIIFMFALAIQMLAKLGKSKFKVLDFNNFMRAEYMNKNQVKRTKGWNVVFLFAQLFGLIALGGFIGITFVWFMTFTWNDFNIPQIIILDDFKKQILTYVSYGLAGSIAISLFFSLISIASLKHNFYNTRALFTQNIVLSSLGVIASAAYIAINLKIDTIFDPISAGMSIGQILIIITLFTLIPGLIAYLILSSEFVHKQHEKSILLYSYVQTLNKNKQKAVVARVVDSQPAVANIYPQQTYNSNTPPIYVNVTNTQPVTDRKTAKEISELHKEISELKKTVEVNITRPVITTNQMENIPTYVEINKVASKKSTIYPIWKNRDGVNPRFGKKKTASKKKSRSKKQKKHNKKIVFKERGFFKRKPLKNSKKKK